MTHTAQHAAQDEVTRLLEALERGDGAALDTLFPLVYEELRAVAHRQRQRWQGDRTLNTTALVHEAYLKLVDQSRASWECRAHFLAAAAKAMRHILINYSRDRRAQKRGGDPPKLSLEELGDRLQRLQGEVGPSDDNADLLLALDAALRRLERVNARQGRIVECRFFGGMTIEETAAALGVSTATVSRGWALAQVRLYQDLKDEVQA
ncbi:MAG: ECF-type sigma factor [Gemmatimonadaceae bacterium]